MTDTTTNTSLGSPAHDVVGPASAPFRDRHIGPTGRDVERMLAALGYAGLDELAAAAVPEVIRWTGGLDLPLPATEAETYAELRVLAGRNRPLVPMIGLGYFGTHTPAVVLRNVVEDPAWYTAYTPYQPEISQGRLEALLNFQTVVIDLTGLPVAGSSLLDEPTAAAEAMTLCRRAGKSASHRFVVDADTHPQTLAVLATRAEPLGIELVVADVDEGLPSGDFFGVLLSYPGSSGVLRDHEALVAEAHGRGALVVSTCDLLALTLLRPPGEIGVDVSVGSAQRLGVPLGFGGPHAGFMSVRAGLERSMPGRLVGVSLDADGATAYRLALQTREQHIRREKATSNICTAQVLLAVVSSMYACYHGPEGLAAIARRAHRYAAVLAAGLSAGGVEVVSAPFFDTITVVVPDLAADVVAAAEARDVNLRLVDRSTVGISTDETTTDAHLRAVWAAFDHVVGGVGEPDAGALARALGDDLPAGLVRTSGFLTHPVFHDHRSETAMLRYLRRLSDRDLALDRSMIPLGSCTMKLNATTEMEPMTWPEFAGHPPLRAARPGRGLPRADPFAGGLARRDHRLRRRVAAAQRRLAGRVRGPARDPRLPRARGEGHRDVCLIPSSAHGTNAASAVMAGLRVVVVSCDGKRRCRPRRPAGQDRPAWGPARRAHDHLPVDARRVRARHRGDLRPRPRGRRPGLRRRREPQRARRPGQAGEVRGGRLAPEPAQDVLHPARRRRSRRGAGGGARAPRALSCRRTRFVRKPDLRGAATPRAASAP